MLKKKTFSVILFILTVTSISSAGPQIFVEKDVLNDICTYGKPTNLTFTVKNVGDEPLVIEEVKKTCRCTSVDIEKKILEPHEDTEISIEYEPVLSKEEFNLKILVKSNAVNEPQKVLTVVGRNYPSDIRITPKVINITQVINNIVEVKPVEVTIETTKDVSVSSIEVQSTNNDKDTENENKQLFFIEKISKEEDKHKVVLQVSSPHIIGNYKNILDIAVVKENTTKIISIPMELKVVPEFEMVPPEIIIPSFSESVTYTIRMLVKSKDSVPFEVKSVESHEEFIETKIKKNESGSYFVYFTINRILGVEGKTFFVTITLEKNDSQLELKYPIKFEQ